MMENRLKSFFNKLLEPDKTKPITVTSPPSSLPPSLASLVARNRSLYSRLNASDPPVRQDALATLFDLANKGIIRIEEGSQTKEFTIQKLNDNEKYSFERSLTSCIPNIGFVNLSIFCKNFNRLIFQFYHSLEDDALNYGLYNTKISPRNLTELGKNESLIWKEFYRYILKTIDDKSLASKKIQQWIDYLPYATAFLLGRAWIKMFDKLEAQSPCWFKISEPKNSLNEFSSNQASLKLTSKALIKMGNKITDPYFDW
jgi:hypothetical protein